MKLTGAGWRTGLVAVLVGVGLGTAPAPASAGGELIVAVDGGGPLFEASNFYPGAETSSVVRVGNAGAEEGELSVASTGIVDEDHCSPVEARAGMPCGPGRERGDLGEQIELSIAVVGDGADLIVWQGSVYELEEGVVLTPALPPGAEMTAYRFSARLPFTSGNEIQLDALQFDVRFNLGGQGTIQVAGIAAGDHTWSPSMADLGLPATGWPLATVVAGLLHLISGWGLIALRRRR